MKPIRFMPMSGSPHPGANQIPPSSIARVFCPSTATPPMNSKNLKTHPDTPALAPIVTEMSPSLTFPTCTSWGNQEPGSYPEKILTYQIRNSSTPILSVPENLHSCRIGATIHQIPTDIHSFSNSPMAHQCTYHTGCLILQCATIRYMGFPTTHTIALQECNSSASTDSTTRR